MGLFLAETMPFVVGGLAIFTQIMPLASYINDPFTPLFPEPRSLGFASHGRYPVETKEKRRALQTVSRLCIRAKTIDVTPYLVR